MLSGTSEMEAAFLLSMDLPSMGPRDHQEQEPSCLEKTPLSEERNGYLNKLQGQCLEFQAPTCNQFRGFPLGQLHIV